MGNFLTSIVVLATKFLSLFSYFTGIVYGILSLIFLTVFVFLLPIAYKKVRRKFPLKVNCWFCNKNTSVPYELFNCWECPHCNQYNGFSKDGGYNKIIPEQYNYRLNKDIVETLRMSVETRKSTPQTNGFCKLCNINQQLKIQQLALFVPLNENNYYEEVEQYREKLEKAYQLCSECEKTLQHTLEKQEYKLFQDKLNYHKHSNSMKKAKNFTKFYRGDVKFLFRKYGVLGLKIIQSIVALILLLALVIQHETESQFLKLTLPEFDFIAPLLPYIKVFLHYQEKVYSFKKELSFAGLVFCSVTYFEFLVNKNHCTLLCWGILHISLWSFYTRLQLIISGLCFFFNIRAIRYKLIQLRKKPLSKKSSFQPVKKVFSEFRDYQTPSEERKPFNSLSSPLLKNDSFSSLEDIDLLENIKIKETKQRASKVLESEEKKKVRQKEDEIESFPNDESKGLSSSFMNKSFVSSVEADKNPEESSESFAEVYNNLNSLQLGNRQKKSNKPPNFLFAHHNFSDTKSTSIIKPAKFIKNLNSSPWTESNECNSRSSTPSSGYSSQKSEKVEHNRYDFSKPMSPFPLNFFNRHSPNPCFDYYGGNQGFYNAVNCFSPSFMPFQQFPGAMGHTTIYTCTRPTNFPFPISSWQGFPPQKFSPSSRFSDASDCDKLFKESCKILGEKKWFKLKTVLYYCSIFFNFITVMSLVYFTSTGIISVDLKLPKFNFFM